MVDSPRIKYRSDRLIVPRNADSIPRPKDANASALSAAEAVGKSYIAFVLLIFVLLYTVIVLSGFVKGKKGKKERISSKARNLLRARS